MDPLIWRILYNYYKNSFIIVKVEGLITEPFHVPEGVKQGGILSPFLFNFFLDKLLSKCQRLNIWATIGSYNTCILAYCDDLLLQASNETQKNSHIIGSQSYFNHNRQSLSM